MTNFHTSHVVKAGRKRYSCAQCGQRIDIGSPRVRSAGFYDGYFYVNHTHTECEDAALAYARLHRLWDEDYPWFQHMDVDPDDVKWMLCEHPIVAARLGWEVA